MSLPLLQRDWFRPGGSLVASGLLLLLPGCSSTPEAGGANAAFQKVRPVLEGSCVHCHGLQRLPGMPALADTRVLAGLIGPAGPIIPGQPDQSRFYQVVTLTDQQPGAMPPTGHALKSSDREILRTWIQEGAPLPDPPVALSPRGTVPRSR